MTTTTTTIRLRIPDDASAPDVMQELRATGWGWIADQIDKQTKPSPPEPTEFASVVRAHLRWDGPAQLWQRTGSDVWEAEDGQGLVGYGSLIGVEVVRVGVGESSAEVASAADAEPPTVDAGDVPAEPLGEVIVVKNGEWLYTRVSRTGLWRCATNGEHKTWAELAADPAQVRIYRPEGQQPRPLVQHFHSGAVIGPDDIARVAARFGVSGR